ncbi:MAG: SIMPL domain-containing protein [Nocardioides sp.]
MRTVTVTGQGEARVVPDSAVVRVAAVHRAEGVAEALAGAASASRQAATTAREHTTPERIATTTVQIWPVHDDRGAASGYEATHSLTIRCPGIDEADALLASLTESVGDRLRVEGVSLEVADPSAAETAAREAAFADAVARATHLAELAEAELGETQEVVEGGSRAGTPRLAKAVAMDASLEPGERAVSSAVTVTFQLR